MRLPKLAPKWVKPLSSAAAASRIFGRDGYQMRSCEAPNFTTSTFARFERTFQDAITAPTEPWADGR